MRSIPQGQIATVTADAPAAPGAATPIAPDQKSKREQAPAISYFPSGFTSQRSPVTNASPKSATASPSQMSFATKGGAAMEKGVYTEVSTPMTPVGAFARKGVQRPSVSPAKVSSIVGGTAQNAQLPAAPWRGSRPLVTQPAHRS